MVRTDALPLDRLASRPGVIEHHAGSPDPEPPMLPESSAQRPRIGPGIGGGVWRTRLVLLVAVAGVRFAFAVPRRTFGLSPDEPATLAMARWMAGGTRWNMFEHDTWRPGVALLIVPFEWVFDDPTHRYRAALAVLALLAGVAAVLLAELCGRLTTFGRAGSAGTAAAVCLMPSALSATSYVWAESAVSLAFLATLLALVRFTDRPSAWRAALPPVCAAAGFLFHSRVLPLLGVTVVIVVAIAARDRRPVWGGVAMAAGAVGYAAVTWFSSFVVARVWDDPDRTNTASSTFARLAHPGDVAEALVGQAWYQLVATAGVVGIGLIVLVRGAVGRDGIPVYRLALVATATMVAVSAVFLAGRERGDYAIYGRYNDAVVWPVVVLGVAWLADALPRAAAAAPRVVVLVVIGAFVVFGVTTDVLSSSTIATFGVVEPMVSGLIAYVGPGSVEHVVALTALAAVLSAALFAGRLAAARPRVVLAVAGVALLVLGGVRLAVGLDRADRYGMSGRSVIDVERSIVADGGEVAVRFVDATDAPAPRLRGPTQSRRVHDYQFFLQQIRFVQIREADDAPGIRYVFAAYDDPVLAASGAEVVWNDPVILLALWDRDVAD